MTAVRGINASILTVIVYIDPMPPSDDPRVPESRADIALRVQANMVEMLRLRELGIGYTAIGRRLNLSSVHVKRLVERALNEKCMPRVYELRRLELLRLQELDDAIRPQYLRGIIPAIVAATKLSERRSKLLGLDNSVQQQVEVTQVPYRERDLEMNELSAQLAVASALARIDEKTMLQIEAPAKEQQVS